MSNFQSYQAMPEEAQLQPVHEHNAARIVGGTVRATTLDGVMTSETQGHERGHSGQLNPHHGDGSVLATAQHPKGLPVTVIEPSTLLTIDGLQAPVSFWVSEGCLQRAADGTYSETTGAPMAAPAAVDEDHSELHPENQARIAAVLDGMASQQVDALLGCAIGAASGKLEPSAVAAKFGQITGHGPDEANARLGMMQAIFQGQADRALTGLGGLSEGDLPGFYEWAKASRQDQLQDAIGRQVHMKDVGGYRVLAQQYLSAVPPSIDAFKAAGVPTRKHASQTTGFEVYVNGSWMSAGAAAKAGLV